MNRCWAEVDLNIIKTNVEKLHRSKDFMAVVKANGYGHGAIPVAKAALEAGATWLGVAIPEEGIELREAGIKAPILALSEPFSVDGIVDYGLIPVVYTREFIAQLPRGYPVHLKVDTGMHRVGCQPNEASSLVDFIKECGLELQGFMTHLAGASDLTQLAVFNCLLRELDLTPDVLIHAASSSAVQSGIGKYNMDRCGIAMYDGAMALKSSIKLIQRVKAGEGVSYGWNYRPEEARYIGIIPIGYADGVPRKLIGTDVWIKEKVRSPIVSVTMDQLIVDIGNEPFQISVGDEVDLLIHEWPSRLDTISYETLTGIRKRVPRYYKQ